MSDRDKIKQVLSEFGSLTSGQVAAKTGLTPKHASAQLSAMVLRTKEVTFTKGRGSYAKYTIRDPVPLGPKLPANVSLKLAQLRALQPALLKAGFTLVNEVISDYENLLSIAK